MLAVIWPTSARRSRSASSRSSATFCSIVRHKLDACRQLLRQKLQRRASFTGNQRAGRNRLEIPNLGARFAESQSHGLTRPRRPFLAEAQLKLHRFSCTASASESPRTIALAPVQTHPESARLQTLTNFSVFPVRASRCNSALTVCTLRICSCVRRKRSLFAIRCKGSKNASEVKSKIAAVASCGKTGSSQTLTRRTT